MNEHGLDNINSLIARQQQGDPKAKEELLDYLYSRLRPLASRLLHGGFSGVDRFEQTDDVLQRAAIKLKRSLESVELVDAKHFFNLAAQKIRQVLLDMKEQHDRGGVFGNQYQTNPGAADTRQINMVEQLADRRPAPTADHELREQLLRAMDSLPAEQREILSLKIIHDMSADAIGTLVGLSSRQVNRILAQARLELARLVADR